MSSKTWYKDSIGKTELPKLEAEVFPGTIHLIQSYRETQMAIKALLNEPLLGFDTETKPSRQKGEFHNICLVQLSTENTCFLFRTMDVKIMEALKCIFENDQIMKIGLSLKDDFRGIAKMMDFKPVNFIDIQTYVKQFGIIDNGLSRIYANVFGKRIAKNQRMSNWEADFLTPEQKNYAALDAWATRRIYTELEDFKNAESYIPKYDIQLII